MISIDCSGRDGMEEEKKFPILFSFSHFLLISRFFFVFLLPFSSPLCYFFIFLKFSMYMYQGFKSFFME